MEEQHTVATKFVSELLVLDIVEPIAQGSTLKANGTLQVIPKPGQPGQWRVLSDMCSKFQNNHIAIEPVHYPECQIYYHSSAQ
eukprot:11552017-Ditylum_brightwellii.AAC.1